MCLTAVPTPGCTTPLPNSVREGAGTGGSSTTRAFLDFHTGADHIMIDIAPNATISRGPAVWLPSPDPLPRISPLRSAERRTVAESWRLATIWTSPRLTSASLLSVINATPLGRWECTDMLPRAFPQPHQRCVNDVIRLVPVALAAVIASGLLTASGMPSEAFAGSWRRE